MKQIVVILLCLVLLGILMAPTATSNPQREKSGRVVVRGSWAGITLMNEMTRQYTRFGSRSVTFQPCDSNQVFGSLKKHECDVGLVLPLLAPAFRRVRRSRLEAFPVGRLVVGVAVNARNPIDSIPLEQLRNVFAGQITNWKQLSRAKDSGPIELYAPMLTSMESSVFQQTVMHDAAFAESLRAHSTQSSHQRLSGAEVIGAIAQHANAIGFFLHESGTQVDKRVRVVRIAERKDSSAVAPTAHTAADGTYPLYDALTLWLHPDAPPDAREFIGFATGPEGAIPLVRRFSGFFE